jgi:hypothetical protein
LALPGTDAQRKECLEYLITGCYWDCVPQANKFTLELYHRLEPPLSEFSRHAVWRKAGDSHRTFVPKFEKWDSSESSKLLIDLETATKIKEWCFRQVDWEPIDDALGALARIAAVKGPDSQTAVDAYMAIYEKLLAGWPGFTGYSAKMAPPHPETQNECRERLEYLIEECYAWCGAMTIDKYTNQLYQRLEPPEDEADRLEKWFEAGHDQNGNRQ